MSFPNPQRELGSTGVKLPALGFGAMGMSESYSPAPGSEERHRALLKEAVALGCTFWDTADMYGIGANEKLIAPVLQEFRDKVFICTKFGLDRAEDGSRRGVRGDREYVLAACDRSLQRLGVKQIDECLGIRHARHLIDFVFLDLYYLHRVDPKTPIEETVKAMKELQDTGKVKYLGLSECSAATLERALKVARIEAVQVEYSPWETGPERSGVLDVMRKHKISLVAYSPLGRGMLTGVIKSPEDLGPNDFRRTDPRYQGEAFKLNLRIVDKIKELAEEKSKATGITVTAASFCLAWVLFQGEDFFVIPGTKSLERFKENLSAGRVLQTFTKEDDEAVRKIVKELDVVGNRYAEAGMATVGH